MAKREEYDVTILSRRDVDIYPKLGVKATQVWITYVGAGLAPSTVYLEKGKDTPEGIRKAIRDDIESRLKQKPQTIKV